MDGADAKILDEVTRSLVNKILHEPMTNLKSAENGISVVDRVNTLKSLFGLAEESHEEKTNGKN